ncbi:MAG: alpha-ketoacid dehydrogenase subunit beta [Bdellovibrionales bacterium]|nr:alpha-ketoacid dehydrogenase subunit beta [Bdellovibrionales bacterium]
MAEQLITYVDAIRQALLEEMRRDENVFCMGEDIGAFGGAFKITKGLLEEFGEDRVIDSPICENAIIGLAVGASLCGMRPVVEMQFADFVSNGFNQIVNNAATTYYRWRQPVPMVIRLPSGGGLSAGPWHSQNNEAWFFHVPGLKIVAPSTTADAHGLLKSAIRDNNPVLYFENKYLYRREKDALPPEDNIVEIGKARIAREGSDATVVTYASMVQRSLEAAELLEKEGLEIEVIDLRSLLPWDRQSVLASAKKTSRILMVHEATKTGGIGAEIAASIAEEAFEYLDAPLRRVCSHDTPVPYAPPLEEFFMPSTEKIADALRSLCSY